MTSTAAGALSQLREATAGMTRVPIRVDAEGLRVTVRKGRKDLTLLQDISLAVEPGELVAIVGGSGAGKSTLLNALSGIRPPDSGSVCYNGIPLAGNEEHFRSHLGFVPQDDIVHRELTVERTLHYASRLRLPADMSRGERLAAVEASIRALDLTSQADQRVSSLSGGQRKRVSIGAELLTNPGLFFLDEPTSGLDPATGREMMRTLRRLADSGSTVILTTHAPQDIASCDRVVFLARGGYLAFAGTPHDALGYFGVDSFEAIYERVAEEREPAEWAARFHEGALAPAGPRSPDGRAADPPTVTARAGFATQFVVLTQRNFEIMWRNGLTLAILIGTPLLVIAMFAILFRAGAFNLEDNSPSATIMILFWVAFGGFFFGLTYGLLMICTEFAVFFRERLVDLGVGPYVLSKLAVLMPILLFVVVLMLGVLRALDRLPSGGFDMYGPMFVTLTLDGVAAITLGLLASAAVSKPEQATLVLPLLCFPQVLFSGAMLPVPLMAPAGKAISYAMSDRWAFEALGQSTDIEHVLADGASPLGPPLLAQYEDTFSNPEWQARLIMAGFSVLFLVATYVVLRRKGTSFA